MRKDANACGGLAGEPVDYAAAVELQRHLVTARRAGRTADLLWLLEHPRTITWGASGGLGNLLRSRDALSSEGWDLHPTRRGGDVTCHEPGQLVGYPIVDIRAGREAQDLHAFLRSLEGALIDLLGDLGLSGRRVEGRTGVWLAAGGGHPTRKIAAMGIACSRWVTYHGFALNVTNDLAGFARIVPCGISDAGVTSLARELGPSNLPTAERLRARVHHHLERHLSRPLRLLVGAEAFTVAQREPPDGHASGEPDRVDG